jgi:wobble nucleotide-excising tRNase
VIEELVIAGTATYPAEGRTLTPLKRVNYLFGTNGSGKTTISRVIADPTQHESCSMRWSGARELEALVFNSDYAERNYASEMPGIFTLGESSAEVLAEIAEKKDRVTVLRSDIERLRATLGPDDRSSGKLREVDVLAGEFTDTCWAIKQRHDDHFQAAFTGVRNSKRAFCEKILSEFVNNRAALVALTDLQTRAKTVFSKGLERLDPIAVLDCAQLVALEQNPILLKKIVGKDDLEIAVLIKRLGSSDWVRAGMRYMDLSDEQCPFCQQSLSRALGDEIRSYFDETYARDMSELSQVRSSYERQSTDLIARLNAIQQSGHQHIDRERIQAEIAQLSSVLDANLSLLDGKAREPSAPITLAPISEVVAAVMEHLAAANQKVGAHNALLDNLAQEQASLRAEIWRCVLAESDAVIRQYTGRRRGLDTAVASLTEQIDTAEVELAEVRRLLRQLEARVTSVLPTVNAINRTLESFGFSSFRLAQSEQSTRYQIVRPDGADAARSLSEGERSFVTFLYFYHSIRGSLSESGTTEDRVIVIDDPVSSLDSDVLFIVSTLIKQLVDEAHTGRGHIKQIIILTHNIYFHKEVSFDQKRRGGQLRNSETFWVVRKMDGVSEVKSYDHNPIKTSYQLLWEEVRNPNRSKATIQNTLRRIVENYFKILGNQDKDEIVALFEGRDKQLAGSLFAWVNDGSHSVHDDLYVSADDALVERYLRVFKEIFERTQHIAHYNMMMGIEGGQPAADAAQAPAPVEANAVPVD